MTDPVRMTGACHCAALKVCLKTSRRAAEFNPRACDCSFCTKHGARWISDPAGQLEISVESESALHRYRQGSQSADLLVCANCGVVVAVTYSDGARLYGALNASCLDGPGDLGASVVASPQHLPAPAKQARWADLWCRDVEIRHGPTDVR